MKQQPSQEIKRNIRPFAAFAILLLPFVYTFEGAAIGPALNVLAQAFPDASTMAIQYVMNLPFLTVIPVSIVTGRWLVNRFDKKTLVVFGLLLYAISGILPGFVNNIEAILLLRLLTGIGAGLVLPLPNMMISEVWGGQARERKMGLASAVQSASSTAISIIVGFVMVLGWRWVFYTFVLILIVAFIALAGLPKFPRVSGQAPEQNAPREKIRMPRKVWLYAGLMCGNWMFWSFAIMNLAFFGAKLNIGGGAMGLLVALPGLFGILAASFITEYRKLFKRFFPTVAMLVYALSFYLYSTAENYFVLVIASLACAFGGFSMQPYIFDLTAKACESDPRAADAAFGIVTPGMMVGALLMPVVQAAYGNISGNTGIEFLWSSCAVFLVAFAILLAFTNKDSGAVGTPPRRKEDRDEV